MKLMNVIIVEDEMGAANSLKLLLEEISPATKVLATLTSIEQTLEWLSTNDFPDLAFFDIQLEDGLSFEIFKRVEIDFPVVFTTAFDQYAIDAFKVNSIDYLLKPIKDADLLFSLKKYENLNKATVDRKLAESILNAVSQSQTTTFLVHYRDKLIPVAATEIAFFYIDNGLVHGYTHGRQVYPIENTLDELETTLRRQQFFRANRQFIINKTAVKDLEFYLNGRLLVNMLPPAPESILISKARVPVFKEWLTG
jgi:two-component system, LytTR family, response regulator LytT